VEHFVISSVGAGECEEVRAKIDGEIIKGRARSGRWSGQSHHVFLLLEPVRLSRIVANFRGGHVGAAFHVWNAAVL